MSDIEKKKLEKKNLEKRDWALTVLTRVLADRRMLDEVLASVPEDMAGTLRWKGRLDWLLDELALKKKPSGRLRKALLLGAYQLLNQPQVPPAWIVSETVDGVRAKDGAPAARFANALLRRIADHAQSWRELSWPDPENEPKSQPERASQSSSQAAWASLPGWIWNRVVQDHGIDWARSFAVASLNRPAFWVRSRRPLAHAVAGPISESWYIENWKALRPEDLDRSAGSYVQDISSQLLIHEFTQEAKKIFGELGRPEILDLCAAPGGKSTGLAWNGWQVFATDRQASTPQSQQRFERLRETGVQVQRMLEQERALGLPSLGNMHVLDRAALENGRFYDAVWVDAPCTGSGLLRRHPEIRWIKDELTLASLQKEQTTLLQEAASKVRPGGLLMFTVCSVLKVDELEEVIRRAGLAGFSRVREWTIAPHLPPYGDGFSGVLFVKAISG
jgi:16S rRNA (cytosine967-C5)-methyltransferase